MTRQTIGEHLHKYSSRYIIGSLCVMLVASAIELYRKNKEIDELSRRWDVYQQESVDKTYIREPFKEIFFRYYY